MDKSGAQVSGYCIDCLIINTVKSEPAAESCGTDDKDGTIATGAGGAGAGAGAGAGTAAGAGAGTAAGAGAAEEPAMGTPLCSKRTLRQREGSSLRSCLKSEPSRFTLCVELILMVALPTLSALLSVVHTLAS